MNEADGQFISKVVNGVEIKQSYREAYGAKNGLPAKKLLQEPDFRQSLAKQGITLRKLNRHLKAQLDAKKAVVVSKDSHIEYVPDNTAIDNAITKGYKLYGVLKDNQVNVDNRQVTFNGDIDKLAKVVEEMKALREQARLDKSGEIS